MNGFFNKAKQDPRLAEAIPSSRRSSIFVSADPNDRNRQDRGIDREKDLPMRSLPDRGGCEHGDKRAGERADRLDRLSDAQIARILLRTGNVAHDGVARHLENCRARPRKKTVARNGPYTVKPNDGDAGAEQGNDQPDQQNRLLARPILHEPHRDRQQAETDEARQ